MWQLPFWRESPWASSWDCGCLPQPGGNQWGPLVAILVGCVIAAVLGLYDFESVVEAPWVGFPSFEWPGFDLSFGATFWALLPGFIIVYLATTINSISETVAIQQVAWRRPRATDFRVVQGAHNLLSLINLLAAAVGTLPVRIGSANSARVLMTGVAARRVGVYAGVILFLVALISEAYSPVRRSPTAGFGGVHRVHAVAAVRARHGDRFPRRHRRAEGRNSGCISVDWHRVPKQFYPAGVAHRHPGNPAEQRSDNRRSLRDSALPDNGADLRAAPAVERANEHGIPAEDGRFLARLRGQIGLE